MLPFRGQSSLVCHIPPHMLCPLPPVSFCAFAFISCVCVQLITKNLHSCTTIVFLDCNEANMTRDPPFSKPFVSLMKFYERPAASVFNDKWWMQTLGAIHPARERTPAQLPALLHLINLPLPVLTGGVCRLVPGPGWSSLIPVPRSDWPRG